MIVALSGKPGSGKSTIAKRIAARFGYQFYYMGQIRRDAARAKGVSLTEYNQLGERDFSTDQSVDEYVTKLGNEKDNFVIDSRTAFHFIPHAVKLFLDVNLDEGAKRVFPTLSESERNEGHFESRADLVRSFEERMASDRRRYQHYYRIDIFDLSRYDCIIDTTGMGIEAVEARVVDYLEAVKVTAGTT